MLNDTEQYFYVRNAQGDIIGIINSVGKQVVSYTYDTWGKLISITGDKVLGEKNPYRYRGYRYDTETGYYYLQSRYYNPEWGRFLNADAIIGSIGELVGHNLFAYCKNNPINMSDESGIRPIYTQGEETDAMRRSSYEAMSKLPPKGKPNSKDKLHNKDGSVKQERVYGPDREPLLHTDWNHGGVGHVFPHTHEWKDGVRQDGVPFQGPPPPPSLVSNTQVTGWVVAGAVLYWVVSEGSRVVFPPRNLIPVL